MAGLGLGWRRMQKYSFRIVAIPPSPTSPAVQLLNYKLHKEHKHKMQVRWKSSETAYGYNYQHHQYSFLHTTIRIIWFQVYCSTVQVPRSNQMLLFHLWGNNSRPVPKHCGIFSGPEFSWQWKSVNQNQDQKECRGKGKIPLPTLANWS
jgi:hypothetical protein